MLFCHHLQYKDSNMYIDVNVTDKLVDKIRTKHEEKLKSRPQPAAAYAKNIDDATTNSKTVASKTRIDESASTDYTTTRSRRISKDPYKGISFTGL